MMPSVAATIVRRWVALYTRGLAGGLRDDRRAELESDLWAHAEDAYAAGHPPTSLDVEMLTRLAFGIPADLAWRWSHRTATKSVDTKEIVMDEPRSHQVLTAVGVGLAAIGLAFAVLGLVAIQQNSDDRPADVLAASAGALAMIAGLGLVLIGLLLSAILVVIDVRHAQRSDGSGDAARPRTVEGGFHVGTGRGAVVSPGRRGHYGRCVHTPRPGRAAGARRHLPPG